MKWKLTAALLILPVLFFAYQAFAADTGVKVPVTVESGGNWTNPFIGQINTDDNFNTTDCANAANCDAGGGTEDEQLSDFAFSIPAGATIDGIEVLINGKCVGANCSNAGDLFEAALSWDNNASWTAVKQTSELTTSDVTYTLGSPTDTWGRSWIDSEFADGTFQLSLGAQCNSLCTGANRYEAVDIVWVKVYYTEAAAAGVPPTTQVQISNGSINISNGSIIIK